MTAPVPEPCGSRPAAASARLTVGMPASAEPIERRVPLTPEAVEMLHDQGVRVLVQEGAGEPIHYNDRAYARAGAEICSRGQALGCEVVVYLPVMSPRDCGLLARGGTLLTLAGIGQRTQAETDVLLNRRVLALALDLVRNSPDDAPIADALAQAEGAGAVALAAGWLANGDNGKGIVMGGVAGVPPCEVVVMGSGIAAQAAARAAAGLGAVVRMFDADVQGLRRASASLRPAAPIVSTPYPHVLQNAFRSADVLIVAGTSYLPTRDDVRGMKSGVTLIDLTGQAFNYTTTRRVYSHIGSRVARTSSMALSNALAPMLLRLAKPLESTELPQLPGQSNALGSTLLGSAAMQRAALTYMGRVVNPELARRLGMRSVDITIYLSLS